MLEGQMMDRPLQIIDILKHAARAFPTIEVVSRTVEGPIHRYGYRDAYKRTARLAHALKALGMPHDQSAPVCRSAGIHRQPCR